MHNSSEWSTHTKECYTAWMNLTYILKAKGASSYAHMYILFQLDKNQNEENIVKIRKQWLYIAMHFFVAQLC